MFNRDVILKTAETCDNFYLYDESRIINSIENLQNNFNGIKFLYSIKTNANPNVVHCVLTHNVGVDAASVAEVMMGYEHNIPMCDIQFSAPAKSKADIEATIDKAIIVADSLNEIALIAAVASEKNIVAEIGVRLNPDFSFFGDVGMSSKFGIDEAQFFDKLDELSALESIKITGMHIHIRSQELNHDYILGYYKNLLKLAKKMREKLGYELKFVNMGSGIGIPYEVDDMAIDIPALAKNALEITSVFTEQFPDTQLYIETGRYLVGKNGVYVTTVLDKKVSYGKTYVMLKNTLSGFIRPSIAQLVTKYSGDEPAIASEPLYTSKNPSQIYVMSDEAELETVTVVGNLCTAIDVVATDISLPRLNIGDTVVFTNAGSYAAVLSPMQFSSQIPPKELFLRADGMVCE